MYNIRMNRSIVSKSSFEDADDHVSFNMEKTPSERLNFACDIINSIFNSSPDQKVGKTIISARKHV